MGAVLLVAVVYGALGAVLLSMLLLVFAAIRWIYVAGSSRGEESGVPEDDDLMALAAAVGATRDAECWRLFEEQCHSLEPLAAKLDRIGVRDR